MRIDLHNNRRRPLPARVAMRAMQSRLGHAPAPMLFFSYSPALLGLRGVRYVLQAGAHPGPWTHGQDELFGSFVSHLNACHY